MPKQIRHGRNTLEREQISDIDVLLNHDKFKRMITRHKPDERIQRVVPVNFPVQVVFRLLF